MWCLNTAITKSVQVGKEVNGSNMVFCCLLFFLGGEGGLKVKYFNAALKTKINNPLSLEQPVPSQV